MAQAKPTPTPSNAHRWCTNLYAAKLLAETDGERLVLVRCGCGERRQVPREIWEQELARRAKRAAEKD